MLAGMPQPLGMCPCRRARTSSRPQQTLAAVVPLRVPLPNLRQSTLPSTVAAAAAADAAAFSAAQQLDGIVPYISCRSPQLKGRRLAANPIQDLWQAASKAALRGELLLAAVVDKHRLAPYVMSALAGVLLGAGLDASTLLRHGLPPYMPDLLLRAFGVWDPTLWSIALTAAALPVTAWALRAWWRANMLLLGGAAAALQQLPTKDHQAGSAAAAGQAVEPVSEAGQQQQQQGQWPGPQQLLLWGSSLDQLVAAAATVLRGLCLTTAAGSFIGLLYTRAASSIATAISAATGIGAVAAAAAAVVLLQQHTTTSSSSTSTTSTTSSSSRRSVLAAMLAAEGAWLAAVAGAGPLVSAAAAAVLGASLYVLHTSVVAPALQQFKAAAGDAVEVHVGLKIAGTQPVFDSTLAEEPVRVVVGPVPGSVQQLWDDAAATDYSSSADEPAQQQAAGSEAGASGSSGGGSSKSLAAVQRDIQGWMKRPGARWESLQPFIAQAAEGLYLGETCSLPLYNPRLVGYWNPSFNWWQPIAEVQQKFKGSMPQVGDVFWYPVVDGAAVPTRVNAIGQDYVELDANYGVTGTALELQVQLVRLHKPAQQ